MVRPALASCRDAANPSHPSVVLHNRGRMAQRCYGTSVGMIAGIKPWTVTAFAFDRDPWARDLEVE